MTENLPPHILKLIKSIENGKHIEDVLHDGLQLLTGDFNLINIYMNLGFQFEKNNFKSKPSVKEFLQLVQQEYSIQLEPSTIDSYLADGQEQQKNDPNQKLKESFMKTFHQKNLQKLSSTVQIGLDSGYNLRSHSFTTPKSKHQRRDFQIRQHSNSTRVSYAQSPYSIPSTPYSEYELEDTPISPCGLRHLTGLVKQYLSRSHPATYKDVVNSLIDELIVTTGPERIKEEKNVRRRVYDAINVLIAAGVLEKQGNYVLWKCQWNGVELDEKRDLVQEKRRNLETNRMQLEEVVQKYLAIMQLVNRNGKMKEGSFIHFPFIAVATADMQSNSISIALDDEYQSMHLKMRKPMQVFGDMDILLQLKLCRDGYRGARKYLPHQDLLKYCTFL